MRSKKLLFLLIFLLGLLSIQGCAQGSGQASYEEGGERWTNKRQPPDKVMEAIGVRPGMVIGEVGAGRGRYTVQMAHKVGETGKIYANDINKSSLDYLEERCRRLGLANVETILGRVDDPLFPKSSLDMAFMILTYHHLAKPVALLKNLIPSLKPGATIVIVDPDPVKDTDRGGTESTSEEQMRQDAGEAGLELVRIEDFLEKDNIFILKVKAPISGYVDVGKVKLYYEEQGRGTPLIMIHGGGLDRRNWDDQFDVLAGKYRVVRYDARYHGLSKGKPDTFSHYEDLFRLMESLEIPKAVIMGLSMGGYVAIDFALAHPDRVIALIPVSPGLTGYEFKDKEILENDKKIKEAKNLDEAVEYIMRSWMDGPRRTPDQVDPAIRNKARQMYKETFEDWPPGTRELRSEPPAIGRLSEIRVPTLVIAADLDMPGILEIAGLMEKNIPGAKKAVIKGAAHLVNMEKPQEFNRIVLDFLSTIPAPPSRD